MTHNRNFRKSVRGLAEQKGVNYTEALKEFAETQNDNIPTEKLPYVEDGALHLGYLQTNYESFGRKSGIKSQKGFLTLKDNDLVTWFPPNAPSLLLDGNPGTGKTVMAVKLAKELSKEYTVKAFTVGESAWSTVPSLVYPHGELLDHLEAGLESDRDEQVIIIDLPEEYIPPKTEDLLYKALHTGRSKRVYTIFVGRRLRFKPWHPLGLEQRAICINLDWCGSEEAFKYAKVNGDSFLRP